MTRSRLRLTGSAVALATSAVMCLGTTGGSADASPAHHPATRAAAGRFTFVTAGTTLNGKEGKQVGLFHGAINGGGSDQPRAQSDVAHLRGGTITIEHPDKGSTFSPKVDPDTCYVTFRFGGPFTLAHGTGRYRGVTGSGTYHGTGYGYLKHTKSGGCDMRAEPSAEVFSILGKGTLG